MLTHIDIRNFAIIECLELSLDVGMTVLTGETGAGKSILVDALSLALGARADNGAVRHGCERAEIAVRFDISRIELTRQWLAERDLEADDECLVRRSITREGRSKGYINGYPVPMQSLQGLGEMLVDIHGQHEHQSLLKAPLQRQMLDDYAGHEMLLSKLARLYQHWKTVCQELTRIRGAAEDRSARLDLLRYQVLELEALALGESEFDELTEEHARLANVSRLLESCQGVLGRIDEHEQASALSLLTRALTELQHVCQYDKRLGPALELLDSASIQTKEATAELRHYLDDLELDPERLRWVETRLDSVHDLSRKHHVRPGELHAYSARLAQELEELQGAGLSAEQLQSEVQSAESAYRVMAHTLSAGRAKAAGELSERVSAVMQQLNMAGGRFEVVLETLPTEQASASGMERVEFLVSANPGQPLKPLNKVASGGELSRISLAIQVVTANSGRIPTLVFDEVDVGIGGSVAEIVGQQLRALGERRQILCVTHLPQVAALGRHHLQVSKQTGKGIVKIDINSLSMQDRRTEIARMLGGIKITEQTLAHATEMVQRAQET